MKVLEERVGMKYFKFLRNFASKEKFVKMKHVVVGINLLYMEILIPEKVKYITQT